MDPGQPGHSEGDRGVRHARDEVVGTMVWAVRNLNSVPLHCRRSVRPSPYPAAEVV